MRLGLSLFSTAGSIMHPEKKVEVPESLNLNRVPCGLPGCHERACISITMSITTEAPPVVGASAYIHTYSHSEE